MALTRGEVNGIVAKCATRRVVVGLTVSVASVGLLACGEAAEQHSDAGGVADASADAARGDAGIVRRDAAPFDAAARDASTTCERVTVESEPATVPEVMIVMDKSNSMNARPSGSAESLWDGATDVVETLTERLEGSVAFGLGTFPQFEAGMPLTKENTCRPGDVRSNLALHNADEISSELRSASVRGNTPTASTLNQIRTRLAGMPKADPIADRIVVLVTDGAPNCGTPEGTTCVCTFPSTDDCDPLNCLDDDAAVEAIEGLADDDVQVYVIGFAVSGWSAVLNRMAAAGGTGASEHIPAGDTSELEEALNAVTHGALPCEYELSSEPSDVRYVRVVLDGQQVNPESASPERGWRIVGTEIQLVGAACDTLRDSSRQHSLDITIECQQVPLI